MLVFHAHITISYVQEIHVIRIRHAAPSMPIHKWDIKELQLTVIEENCQMLLFVDLVY